MNLQDLSISQLRLIEDSLDSYLFKQPLNGEDFHQSYRKNKQSFDLLIRQTVKLQRVIRKAFKKQKEKLPTLVQLHRFTADESDSYINFDAWDDEEIDFAADMNIGLMPIYTNGAQTTAEELNIGSTMDASQAPAQKFLANYSLKLAKDINKTTKANIKEAVQTSLKLGENRDALTDRINDILDNPYRSEMIAQTESITAFAQGRLAVGRDIGYDQKTWNAQDGACEYCSGLDGQTIGIDEQFDGDIAVVDAPALHPWCRCGMSLSKSDGNVSAGENGKTVKAGWITKNGAHIYLPDAGERDFSKPLTVPGNLATDAEHTIKYNAALQATFHKSGEEKEQIMEAIYKAPVDKSLNPLEQGQQILKSLPEKFQNDREVIHAITSFAKSAHMIQEYKLSQIKQRAHA